MNRFTQIVSEVASALGRENNELRKMSYSASLKFGLISYTLIESLYSKKVVVVMMSPSLISIFIADQEKKIAQLQEKIELYVEPKTQRRILNEELSKLLADINKKIAESSSKQEGLGSKIKELYSKLNEGPTDPSYKETAQELERIENLIKQQEDLLLTADKKRIANLADGLALLTTEKARLEAELKTKRAAFEKECAEERAVLTIEIAQLEIKLQGEKSRSQKYSEIAETLKNLKADYSASPELDELKSIALTPDQDLQMISFDACNAAITAHNRALPRLQELTAQLSKAKQELQDWEDKLRKSGTASSSSATPTEDLDKSSTSSSNEQNDEPANQMLTALREKLSEELGEYLAAQKPLRQLRGFLFSARRNQQRAQSIADLYQALSDSSPDQSGGSAQEKLASLHAQIQTTLATTQKDHGHSLFKSGLAQACQRVLDSVEQLKTTDQQVSTATPPSLSDAQIKELRRLTKMNELPAIFSNKIGT